MQSNKRTFIFVIILICLIPLSCSLGGTTGSEEKAQGPTPTPIPGWEKFEGGGIELWMPANFEGGDLANDLEVILERLRSLGTQFQQMATMIEQNQSAFVILLYDANIGSSGFLTNVNVVKEKVLSGMKLDSYLDSSAEQLTPLGFNILERTIVQLNSYEAGRLVIEAPSLKAKEVMYVIKAKNTMWVITYTTGIAEFGSRLSVFEKSAKTIVIQP